MSKTLLVIDVQNDFCPGGALAVSEGDQIIPAINGLMVGYDRVILTQDWHPKGHSSFASSHNSKAPLDIVEMPYGPQVLWPDHCMQGTFGAQLHADINQDAAALILRKGSNPLIDSYSAFFENDHVTATGLHGYLQNCGVSALDMVGLATDFCVNYSAVDAAKLGYSVRVLLGACRGIDVNGSLAAAQRDMRDAGVRLEADYG